MLASAKILAIMLALQAPAEEPGEAERYAMIADAVTVDTWRIPPSRREFFRRYLLTIFFHESNYRKEVHSGRVRGDGGRSVGLGQVLFRNPYASVLGVTKPKAAGLSRAATRRHVQLVVRILERGWKKCGGDRPFCIFGFYGGVRKPHSHPRIQSRVTTYQRISK